MPKQTEKGTMRRKNEALKRALEMPHVTHAQKSKRKLTTGKGRMRLGKDRKN